MTPTRRRPATNRAPADLESAVAALGIIIRRADENEINGYCPMHFRRTGKQDAHPSWSVNRHSGVHGCFSCGYAGNFLGLVMDLKFRNNAFAAARWIRRFGVDLQGAVDSLRVWDERHEQPEPAQESHDLAVRFAMYVDPPAPALAHRRATLESARHYGVRWDPERENWILPIREEDRTLIGWQIKAEDGRFFRNFPAGVKKGVTLFGLDVFPEGDPAVLVESPLDVVRLHSAGYSGGLATFGSKWTDAQLRLVCERTDELVCAFDNDDSGHQAIEALIRGDRKKQRKGWVGRMPSTWLLSYRGTNAKDIGDMTDREIERALGRREHWTELVVGGLR